MSSKDKTFYIVLVLAILVILYLFWKKSQERTYSYILFNPDANNASNYQIENMTNDSIPQSRFNDLISDLQKRNTDLRKQIGVLQQKVAPFVNQPTTPETKNMLNQILGPIIDFFNNDVNKVNSKIAGLEQKLDQNQVAQLNQTLGLFNQDIDMFNQVMSPFTTTRVVSLDIPAAISSVGSPVASSEMPIAIAPSDPTEHNYYAEMTPEYHAFDPSQDNISDGYYWNSSGDYKNNY